MVGRYLKSSISSESFEVIETSRTQELNEKVYLDLADHDSINEVSMVGVDHAIIFASITNQEICNKDPELANKVNVEGTIKLLEKLTEKKIHIIFPSTSLVFNGMTPGNTNLIGADPIGVYGKNKYLVERKIVNSYGENTAILRLSKIINKDFQIFHNWCEAFSNDEDIYPFNDLNFSPVSIQIVTDVIFKLLKNSASGIYNLSSSNQLSYAQAAIYLATKFNQEQSNISPINALESLKDIYLPQHTVLDCTMLKGLDIRQPYAEESLDYFIKFNDIYKRHKN